MPVEQNNENVILFDSQGVEMNVASGVAIPAGTRSLLAAGSDGANARNILVDASGRPVTVGAGTAGTAVGGVVSTQGVDSQVAMTLGALNAAGAIPLLGSFGCGFSLNAGSLIGTIVPELSFDGGTTWVATLFDDPTTSTTAASIVFASSNPATARGIIMSGGASHARVRVSAYTSGTASGLIRATQAESPTSIVTGTVTASNPSVGTSSAAIPTSSTLIGGSDGSNLRPLASDSSGILYAATLQQAIARGRVAGIVSSMGGEVVTNATGRFAIMATAYTVVSVNAQRSVSSNNAADAAAGTGARTVRLTYYAVSGVTVTGPFTETVTLNGTTAVNTVATNIAFVEKLEVLTAGSTGSNVGIISIFQNTGGGGSNLGSIAATVNATRWAQHFVASGATCMLYDVFTQNDAASGNNPKVSVEVLDPTVAASAERPLYVVRLDGRDNIAYGRTVPVVVTGPARIRGYVTTTNSPIQTTTFDMSFLEI